MPEAAPLSFCLRLRLHKTLNCISDRYQLNVNRTILRHFKPNNNNNNNNNKIRSVELGVCPMQLFHLWSRRSSSSKSAAMYKISWKSDFQNGGRPPSWNCFTTIRDHPRSLCCWPQLPVNFKFHVNLINRSEDKPIAIWIFRIFGLKCLFRPPKWGFWGTFDP